MPAPSDLEFPRRAPRYAQHNCHRRALRAPERELVGPDALVGALGGAAIPAHAVILSHSPLARIQVPDSDPGWPDGVESRTREM